MNLLENYVSFLPVEGQTIIAQLQQESHEPLSIVTGMHWVVHHPQVQEKLSKLIIMELNKILMHLNASNYSMISVHSVAALTLTPDKCYEECFGNWEDYTYIQNLLPLLEMKLGRPIMLRQKPEMNVFSPSLWKKLQSDSFYRKISHLRHAN